MAIQHRRGDYSKFNSGRMVDGEIAVILSGDPTDNDGEGVYMSFGPGKSKRMAFSEDVDKAKNDAIASSKTYAEAAKQSATASANSATNSATSEKNAASSAESARQSAETAAGYAGAATYSLGINPNTGHMAVFYNGED